MTSLKIAIFLVLLPLFPAFQSYLNVRNVQCLHHGKDFRSGTLLYSTPDLNDVQTLLSNDIDPWLCLAQFDIVKYAVSGGFAGGCRSISRLFTYPFDTIKTLEQADSNLRPAEVDYFRGVVVSVSSAIPANAVFFVIYYYLDQLWTCLSSHSAHHNDPNLILKLVISLVATVPQNFIKVPSELIKQQAQIHPDRTILTVIRDIYQGGSDEKEKEKDLRNFFIGSNAQLLRELPYNAFQMTFFEFFKEKYQIFSVHNAWIALQDYRLVSSILGLIACTLAALLTQPADVIKTKLMTNLPSKQIKESSKKESRFLKEVIQVYKEEGIPGFFAGLLPRLAIVSIGGMIYFLAAAVVEKELP